MNEENINVLTGTIKRLIHNCKQAEESCRQHRLASKNHIRRLQRREEQIERLKKQLEAYENMRKEAIKWINKHKEKLHHNFDEPDWEYLLYGSADELSNILNKVGEDNENN